MQEAAIELFEALGFEKRHSKVSGVSEDIDTVRMKDAGGFYLDITKMSTLNRDMTIIRMNVDDLDEARQLLTAQGLKAVEGSDVTTPTSRSVLMTSPNGFAISVVKHIKDHE